MGWMGPVVDGQEHEGWVVPLFTDGAQGPGTSSARGLPIARRPNDGPGDGDRVRLTYGDGFTAEGRWSDGTLLRGDGIVRADAGGPVHCEVIEQAEEWRPGAEVVGRAAGRTCGWRGTPLGPRACMGAGRPGGAAAGRSGPVGQSGGRRRAPGDSRMAPHIAGWQALEDVEAAAARQAAAARALNLACALSPLESRGPTSAGPPA
ncbi:hypothetical protein GCM10027451_25900 [Geodermatophilus aquaeductus]|uniref:Uncharacterized protein n=1 Tax=Geodermatophilus aquaeductus TaxID=1564161 RepID=A0A521EL19_9ACTN|nr:hypothetical protein [Geodermatophilus aquaeductus]SMO84582.1 hypothetical protein SAMN06273567_105228 [Geodermatophilus aquaeductus]